MKKPTHGGPRKGAGRPTKEPTVVMRIPKGLIEAVEEMIERYKSGKASL